MRERTRLLVSPLQRPLQAMAQAGGNAAIELAWLGQAGFLVRSPKLALAIDPYLSDSLARKYAGTATPHERMMPVPVAPRDLVGLDFVLCTHRHTDHMDPETLTAIFSANEKALLVAPRSARARVREIGVPDARVRYVTAGDVLAPTAELSIRVIASAHEAIDRDENGDYAYVGYALTLGELTVYHSGDCVPHEGLAATLSETGADLALLPVNGRRPELAARGSAVRRGRGARPYRTPFRHVFLQQRRSRGGARRDPGRSTRSLCLRRATRHRLRVRSQFLKLETRHAFDCAMGIYESRRFGPLRQATPSVEGYARATGRL